MVQTLAQKGDDLGSKAFRLCCIYLALPDYQYLPAGATQFSETAPISSGVAAHFGYPIAAPRRRNAAPGAVVHMPETAPHIDDFS
jgi:hypothetical protein